MPNPNIVKTSHNFTRYEKDYLEKLAGANAMTETDVLRSALRLLMALGDRGVCREVDISVPAEESECDREGPTYLLPFNLDLGTTQDQGLPLEK